MNIETTILTLRPYTDDDILRINELLLQLNTNYTPFTREHIDALARDENTFLYVARQKECRSVVGMVILRRSHNAQGELTGVLQKFVVSHHARGNGVGQKLLENICTFARLGGVVTVSLMARESRIEARALYQKTGFREVHSLCEGYCRFEKRLRNV